ncbi:MAG TPA: GAF domain-containing protein [Mycobacteriales bacterium]|jgi:hypothetical protein|nr:GAF domain-containing protein [Mycobacteriales bacterium]
MSGASVTTSVAPARPAEADTVGHFTPWVQTDTVLAAGCRLARDVLGVRRASVLVLDEPGRLVPAVSVAREDHAELWQRFRRMRPIALDVTPAVAAVLTEPRVVVVPDAARSGLVPEEWRTAFGLTSLAIAPLHVEGRPWGVLVVDDARGAVGAGCVRALADLAATVTAAVAATERAAALDAEHALRAALPAVLDRLADDRDLAAAVDAVAPHLLAATGYELLDAVLSDRRLAPAFPVGRTGEFKTVLRQLRGGAPDAPCSDGRLVVPLRAAGSLLGLLELRSRAAEPRRLDLLHETADRFSTTIALVAERERAAAAAADAEHGAERVALALATIDRTLRAFRGPGYAHRLGAALVPVPSTAAGRRAVEELDEVRRVLAVSGHGTLPAALRALLDAGALVPDEIQWNVTGTPRPLPPATEIAVLRSAARFLTLAREARGRVVVARLSFSPARLECLFATNGLLPDPVDLDGDRIHPWVREVGGTVECDSLDEIVGVRLSVPYVLPDRTSDRRPAPARAR